MTDLSVIILTKDEKLHIARCLERLVPLAPRQVFVVDCLSTDGTQEVVRKFASNQYLEDGVTKNTLKDHVVLVPHEWPGLHAVQFNWALDNCPIISRWVLRLDADEYLPAGAIDAIVTSLDANVSDEITAYSLELRRTFWGEDVHWGVGSLWLTRLFRTGIGRCESKKMDEHIVICSGRVEKLHGGVFVDDNVNGVSWWSRKHLGYAEREAQDALAGFRGGQKGFYYRLPPYWRATAYFCYRYFLRGGFLEGKRGFQWHFFQGLWYRMLVDAKILEYEREHVGRGGGADRM